MADSAAKRRKTSPTKYIPIDAPATPSRIPVPRKDGPQSSSRRPSFTSPTKASLSRHHPQILKRPISSGMGGARPESRETALKDVFAKALGEDPFTGGAEPAAVKDKRDKMNAMSKMPENDSVAYDNPLAQISFRRGQSKGSGQEMLPVRPRKQSQSPNKRSGGMPMKLPVTDTLPDDFNPFEKKGLRRSPMSSSAEAPAAAVVQDFIPDNNLDPFRKTGLRRSPVTSTSLPESVLGKAPISTRAVDHVHRKSPVLQAESGITRSPTPLQLGETGSWRSSTPSRNLANESMKPPIRSQPVEISPRKSPFPSKAGLRRSPVISRALDTVEPPEQPQLEMQDANLTAPVKPATSPEVLFAERPIEVRSGGLQIETRQGVISGTVDPMPQTGMLFAESSNDNTEHIKPPSKVVGPDVLITPTEPPRRDGGPTQTTEEQGQESELSNLMRTSQKPELPRKDKAVQDLFIRTRRVEEPGLLPIQTQLGISDPVAITPPTGVHITPSKRARKAEVLAAKLKSSPLKSPDPPPEQPLESVLQPELKVELPKRRKSARFLVPEDPHASKKKARDDLLKEVQQLQADVALANRENERLRRRSDSRKKAVSIAPNPDEVQAMLLRSTSPDRPTIGSPKPKSIFKSINAFLPFRSRRKLAAAPMSDKPLPSHLPMTLNDPLPYLQAFSTLLYTSKISVLPSEPSPSDASSQFKDQPVFHRHVITASHPSGLFSIRFSMTVDTSTLNIAALDILRLDMNAEKELGTFIRARARPENVLGRDITVVCWAMSRWIEVSIQRARFWYVVVNELGTPEARAAASHKKRKRKLQSLQGEDSPATNASLADEIMDKGNWTRRQLSPYIGRSSLEICNHDVELRFEWKISFDWTGEVESVISASAQLPQTWQQADDRSSLKKVPDTFNRLVKERGPLGAVRATVGLLMPSA
ncbi:hypothetical protein QTJ16_004049 [Diplocarpon rosae]|uniref:Uncharacterized protein n=1 Tax=Diplocarpon rosae TaxID=946125 RepID=A0AAD9T1J5_9HELO|nr:hypothetical protein QTJ16_004049 [Diplocarpon rosae]